MIIKNVAKLSPLQRLVYWIKERESIRLKKEVGEPKPWTTDSILRSYRFCNVRREDDKVTQWIAANWREPNKLDPHLWFAMAVARFINWPETLQEIGYPVPWNEKEFLKRVTSRKARGDKVWTGAYMIGTNGNKLSKPLYIFSRVLTPLWENRRNVAPQKGLSLSELASRLVKCFGLSGFMTGQIIADVKYSPVLEKAVDWHTWAISGPGSRRGLNRILGRDKTKPWKEVEWLKEITKLRAQVNKYLANSLEPIHAQDLQNCLCEFDKWERARLEEGRPRSTYSGMHSI